MPNAQIPMTNCQSNLYWIRHLHNSFFHIIGELWQNVQNFAVKPPTCGSWLHLSFEHIAVISTVDEQHGPWKIVADLLNRNRQTNNHWPVSGRELWKRERAHWMNTKLTVYTRWHYLFLFYNYKYAKSRTSHFTKLNTNDQNLLRSLIRGRLITSEVPQWQGPWL